MPRWASEESKTRRDTKKNISMGFETWERLKTFGIFGDSFDDILNRLMDDKEQQPQPSDEQKQQLRQQQKQIKHEEPKTRKILNLSNSINDERFNESIDKIIYPPLHHFQVNLPGIEFPTDKKEIIEYAKKANIEKMVNFLKELPEETYMNKLHVANSFKNIFKDKKDYLGKMYREGIECTINDKEIRQQGQRKQLLQEQEQQLQPQLVK